MGKEAVRFVNRLGDIAAERGRIPKGEFVRWAMQLLSVTVQRGNAEMCRRSGLIIGRISIYGGRGSCGAYHPHSGDPTIISREQGLCYEACFVVPVLTPRWDMCMGCC